MYRGLRGARMVAARLGGTRVIYDLAHININCTDVRRSIAFYEKFGFKVIHVIAEDTKDLDPTADLMVGAAGHHGSHCRGVLMSLGDHPRCWTVLELLEYTEPRTESEPPRSLHQVGYCRMAIRCRDIQAEVERLKSEGVEFECDVETSKTVGALSYAFARDPDGTLVELLELHR
jgi:catechol 2,3-dioxygenase-like lactoylglutathione lyase family enzyme